MMSGVYVHSGSWNEYLTLAWLHRDESGRPRWVVEQIPVPADGPADAELAKLIKETRAKHLTPEDTAVVARTPTALGPAEAARMVVGTLREAAGVDAAFVGNTTFGAGLPAGEVTREEFDVQRAVLLRTREKMDALERTIEQLEARLRSQDVAE